MSKREKSIYKTKIELPTSETFTHLDCPECGTLVPADNINLDKSLAKCNHCDAVFDFEGQLLPSRHKPTVYLPKGMELLKLRSLLELQYKWRSVKTNGFLTFFTLMWNAILFPFVAGIIISGAWGMLFFLSIHLTIGLSLLYYVISTWINTTYITVDEREVSVEHRPLKQPFNPERHFDINDVQQLFVERYVSSRTNGQPNYAFRVMLILKNGNRYKMVQGITQLDHARYIEQEIENYLGITDKKVMDEWV